jgi:conjugative transfer signal peptidase TraF
MRIVKDRKPLLIIPVALLVLWGLHLAIPQPVFFFYLNVSKSEPIGIYRVIGPDAEAEKWRRRQLKHDDYVIITPPPNARPYVYGRGWLLKNRLLLKNVYALPGDKVYITDRAIYINDKYIGPIKTKDSAGLPLPRLRGLITIPAHHFLPIANHAPNSFDGRYFGPVPNRLVQQIVKPVCIWR